jgi:UDP-N-acetylmuramate-alanine ligase
MSERVHVVGIAGFSTSALAVSFGAGWCGGVGVGRVRTTLAGELLGQFPQIKVYQGYLPEHLDGAVQVIHSVAFRTDNPELTETLWRANSPVCSASARALLPCTRSDPE